MVFAMPMARIAVMGPAGKEFVYKDEIRALDVAHRKAIAGGTVEAGGRRRARRGARALTSATSAS